MRKHRRNGLGQGILGLRAMQGLQRAWSRLLAQAGNDGDSLTIGEMFFLSPQSLALTLQPHCGSEPPRLQPQKRL